MTDENPHPPPASYELVMPFVCCQSLGGPYDDNAFAAGVQFGVLYENFRVHDSHCKDAEDTATVHTALVPRLDLLAMHHGYVITSEEITAGWSKVTFRRAPAEERAA